MPLAALQIGSTLPGTPEPNSGQANGSHSYARSDKHCHRQAVFVRRLAAWRWLGKNGRVERWRGGLGFGIIPCRGFPVCVSLSTCRAPFPPPAHRTGRADFPHPALGQGSWFRPRVATGKFLDVQQAKLAFEIAFGILAASLPLALELPFVTTDGPDDTRADARGGTPRSRFRNRSNWPTRATPD